MQLGACKAKVNQDRVNQWCLVPTVISILVIYAHKYRRVRRIKIVVPLDSLLDNNGNQAMVVLAFGTMVNDILRLMGASVISTDLQWVNLLKNIGLYIANFVVVALINYPVFMCIASPYKFLSSIIGGLFVLSKMVLFLISITMLSCDESINKNAEVAVKYAQYLPSIVCFIALIAKFLQQLVGCVKRREFLGDRQENASQSLATIHHVRHLQQVLTKNSKYLVTLSNHHMHVPFYKKPFRKLVAIYRESLKSSTIFLSCIAVIMIVYYALLVQLVYGNIQIYQLVTHLYTFYEKSNATSVPSIVVNLCDGVTAI